MTEIGEGVALDMIDVEHDADSCPFCQQTLPALVTNVLVAQHDEDAVAARDTQQWIRGEPTPDSLGERLAKPIAGGLRRVKNQYEAGDDLPLALIPHHLIPGPEALQRSTLVSSGRYLRVDGSALGNSGYDINSAANGAWVVCNHAYRPWGPEGAAFAAREGVPAQAYCSAAIRVSHAQFHDAHEAYNEIVRDALDRLQADLQHQAEVVCPHGQPSSVANSGFPLVKQRLDALSSRLRRMVCFPTTGWKPEVFLSRTSHQYMIDLQVGGG